MYCKSEDAGCSFLYFTPGVLLKQPCANLDLYLVPLERIWLPKSVRSSPFSTCGRTCLAHASCCCPGAGKASISPKDLKCLWLDPCSGEHPAPVSTPGAPVVWSLAHLPFQVCPAGVFHICPPDKPRIHQGLKRKIHMWSPSSTSNLSNICQDIVGDSMLREF